MLLPTGWRRDDARVSKVSVLLGGAGRAGASGVRGRMRVGFRPRPSPAGGHEEHRGQGSAGSANAQEEGRGSAKAGGRPPEGGTRATEEDKRPRAKGTAAADKPAEEGAKGAEEESRLPTAAEPEIGEVGPGRPNSASYPASRGELAPPRSAARRGLLAADLGRTRRRRPEP